MTVERRPCLLIIALTLLLGLLTTTVGNRVTVECGDDMLLATESSNYLTSASYPKDYPSNMNCQWQITAASPSQVVVLKVLDFFIEGSTSPCSYDYVTIYDGSSTQFMLMETLCGHVLPTHFISTGSSLTVTFHSDESHNLRGFKLEYLSQNKSVNAAQCGNSSLIATENSTYLTSPNYPNNYPSNVDCQWRLSSGSSSRVLVLRMLDFDLEKTQTLASKCAYDYVAVYDGINTSSNLIEKVCGSWSSSIFAKPYSSLTVVFHSDGSNNFRGFKLEYTSYEKTAVCANVDLKATETPNFFTLPNYPSNYSSNMDCQWVISADMFSEVVVLKLLDFYLEDSFLYCDDYVAIYDGTSVLARRIQKLCGEVSTTQFNSTGSTLTVVFHSDNNNNFRGFKFEYSARMESTNYYLLQANATAKYFTSPGYPKNYPSSSSWRWTVAPAIPLEVIVLKLLDFHVGGTPPNCTNSHMKIYGDYPHSADKSLTLCGQVPCTQLIRYDPSVTVALSSDESNNFRGFKFEYTSRKAAPCTDVTLKASRGAKFLTSPNYPIEYPSNIYCEWHITTGSRSNVVALEMTDLQIMGQGTLCIDDYVKIYDGPNTTSRLIKVLCDSGFYERIEGTTTDMTVVLHSVGENTNKGFNITYYSIINRDWSYSLTKCFSPTSNCTFVIIITCGIGAPALLLVLIICIRKRAQRRLKKSENSDATENVDEKSLFGAPLLTNDAEKTNPPNFGIPDHQSMFDSVPYTSLDCTMIDKLPGYTPRVTDNIINGHPPYSFDLPGGAACNGQTPLLNGSDPEESHVDIAPTSENGANLNKGFSNDDAVSNLMTGQNGLAGVGRTGDTTMDASTVTSSSPSSVANNPSCPDNSSTPSAPARY